jgi:hypothetical protein
MSSFRFFVASKLHVLRWLFCAGVFPLFLFFCGRFFSASAEFLHLSEAYNGQGAGLLFLR